MMTTRRPFELTISCPACEKLERIVFPATDKTGVVAALEVARLVEPILHEGHDVEVRWRWRDAVPIEPLDVYPSTAPARKIA